MELVTASTNPEAVKDEVRDRILQHAAVHGADRQQAHVGECFPQTAAFRKAARIVRASSALVGEMPPQPPTFRASVGAFLIRLLRRMLSWYTSQILEFHRSVARALEEQLQAFEALCGTLRQSQEEHYSLEERLKAVVQGVEECSESDRSLRHELDVEVRTRTAEERAIESELERLRGGLRERATLEQLHETRAQFAGKVESVNGDLQGIEDRWKAAWSASRLRTTQELEEVFKVARGTREALNAHVSSESHARSGVALQLQEMEQGLLSLRSQVLSQGRRLSTLLEERQDLSQQAVYAPRLEVLVGEDAHKIDAFCADFADEFRGSREDIKDRFRVYLPYLSDPAASNGSTPVLDLGCGRGEWLELLREKGLAAEGVDHNRVIVARCADLGLRVIEADLIEHLRGLSEASFGTVTAFHVIEHLPFSYLVDLIDEALRVLKPGGLMILETPNPANVQLACERFYFDPTHIRPLPSPLIRKLAEARGLCDIEILPLHPWPELSRVEEDGSELVRRFNALFYGPQDYAVIGRKRQSSTRAVALED